MLSVRFCLHFTPAPSGSHSGSCSGAREGRCPYSVHSSQNSLQGTLPPTFLLQNTKYLAARQDFLSTHYISMIIRIIISIALGAWALCENSGPVICSLTQPWPSYSLSLNLSVSFSIRGIIVALRALGIKLDDL